MPRVAEHAPAKVNLDLRVTGRRPDGYHELDSVVTFAAWADRLTFAPARQLEAQHVAKTVAQESPGDDVVRMVAKTRVDDADDAGLFQQPLRQAGRVTTGRVDAQFKRFQAAGG